MVNINFVPEDYIQKRSSQKTNFIYLVLFGIMMTTIGGTFLTIKLRQRAITSKVAVVNTKMAQAHEAITQLEQLREKQKTLIKAAIATADLIEPVPRSILLAILTNELPSGVSLLTVKIVQKKPKNIRVTPASKDKYQTAKAGRNVQMLSEEKMLETYIDIEGIAPSDIEVAGYIKNLSEAELLKNVSLVLSREYEIDDMIFREFKLTAMLRKNVQVSAEMVDKIIAKVNRSYEH